jgi:hypothetical protein
MAFSRIMQSGDTYPPLKGLAADDDGAVDLTLANSMRVLLKSTTALIELSATVIDPIEVDVDDNEQFNWQAPWAVGESDIPGDYLIQLEVTWAAGQIETFPNSHGASPHLIIERANDD